MLPIFFGFPNFQIQIFLFVSLFFLKTKGHDLIFLSDLHNYNIVGYTIAVALVFADIQFFHWKPYYIILLSRFWGGCIPKLYCWCPRIHAVAGHSMKLWLNMHWLWGISTFGA